MTKYLHRIVLVVAAAYLIAVAMVVFWTTPVDRPATAMLSEVLSWLHEHGMPGVINYNFVEFSANIFMFIPMGIIVSAYFKNATVGILVGALGSCLIELAQALLLPDRFSSGLDILANTMGAGLGALVYFFLALHWGRRALSSTLKQSDAYVAN